VTFRATKNPARGVRVFYVASESRPGAEHVVQHIRRNGMQRWNCDCQDFQFRRLAKKRHCKHARELARLAREAHGVSKIMEHKAEARCA